MDYKERTRLIIGDEGISRLERSTVLVAGLGGVGGMCAEALCRAGIGHLILADNDTVSHSNRNRQLIATIDTVGQKKTDAMSARLKSINPDINIDTLELFILPDTGEILFQKHIDYIADCIDTITAKLYLAEQCKARSIPIISSMGAGARLDPLMLREGDISETKGSGCALSRVMRRELIKRGIERLNVIYSKEPPASLNTAAASHGRHPPGSISTVPNAAGLAMAAHIIRNLVKG